MDGGGLGVKEERSDLSYREGSRAQSPVSSFNDRSEELMYLSRSM